MIGLNNYPQSVFHRVNESILMLFSKRKSGVDATIYTGKLTKPLKADIGKFNAQYSKIEVMEFKKSHDRFMIIDEQDVYHIGASLKDLGKRWFAFSKINIDPKNLINKLK